MEELQALRMSVMWPLVVGAAGAVVAWAIAVAWDNGPSFWLAFTAGMLALAVILLVTVVQLAIEMWRNG